MVSFCFYLETTSQTFLSQQKKYSRVREALSDYEDHLKNSLVSIGVSVSKLEIYLRALKLEETLEIWVKNETDSVFQLFKEIPFCTFSGGLGPKRKQGDGQIPEGLYHIDRFNPYSSFHLSLGINYPNAADRILGVKGNLGGDIFLHGSCVSIGCISITDPIISQVYLLAVWAKNNGQQKIPVHFYPFKMSSGKLEKIQQKYPVFKKYLELWNQLNEMYQFFDQHHYPALFKINNDGEYLIRDNISSLK